MAENTSSLPYFSAVGRRTALFSVDEGVSTNTMLECASGFLASAVELGIEGAGMQNGGRWAIVHLAEMAKALVDTAVSRSMEARMGADQAESGVRHG